MARALWGGQADDSSDATRRSRGYRNQHWEMRRIGKELVRISGPVHGQVVAEQGGLEYVNVENWPKNCIMSWVTAG